MVYFVRFMSDPQLLHHLDISVFIHPCIIRITWFNCTVPHVIPLWTHGYNQQVSIQITTSVTTVASNTTKYLCHDLVLMGTDFVVC